MFPNSIIIQTTIFCGQHLYGGMFHTECLLSVGDDCRPRFIWTPHLILGGHHSPDYQQSSNNTGCPQKLAQSWRSCLWLDK